MVFNLSENNSVANQFILEIRDRNIQQDRLRFRKNLERLGEIMAYEVSKALAYTTKVVETPLGKSRVNVLKTQPVIATILRAGLPFFQGFMNFFDHAEAAFVGAYREEEEDVTIHLDYITTPSIHERDLLLVDPMLATGKSIIKSLEKLNRYGTPNHIHIVSMIAAPEGIKALATALNVGYTLWVCAIDEKLNDQFYILPGIGDAGDLSYGKKN
jgi:uracil phosphoribosyltransferase